MNITTTSQFVKASFVDKKYYLETTGITYPVLQIDHNRVKSAISQAIRTTTKKKNLLSLLLRIAKNKRLKLVDDLAQYSIKEIRERADEFLYNPNHKG